MYTLKLTAVYILSALLTSTASGTAITTVELHPGFYAVKAAPLAFKRAETFDSPPPAASSQTGVGVRTVESDMALLQGIVPCSNPIAAGETIGTQHQTLPNLSPEADVCIAVTSSLSSVANPVLASQTPAELGQARTVASAATSAVVTTVTGRGESAASTTSWNEIWTWTSTSEMPGQ